MARTSLAAFLALLLLAAPAASNAQANQPYKIGITLPLTGPFANNSAAFLPSVEIAVAEINAAGGVKGHPVQTVLEDTQATPQGGIEAMRKIVQVDGAQAVLTFYTNVVMAQIPLADQLKVPTLSAVETAGVMEKAEYSFAYSSRSSVVIPLLGKYFAQHHFKRVFAFFSNNSQGQANSPLMRVQAEAAGATYGEALINLTDTDFRGPAIRAKEFNADAIVMNAQGSPVEATVIRQIREAGVTTPIFEAANFYHFKVWHDAVGPYVEGMYFAGLNVDQNSPAGRTFARTFRAKTGLEPDYQAAEVYDIIRLFAYAIGRSSYNGVAIKNVLVNVKDFRSALGGTVSMGADHYAVINGIGLWQARFGHLVPVIVR